MKHFKETTISLQNILVFNRFLQTTVPIQFPQPQTSFQMLTRAFSQGRPSRCPRTDCVGVLVNQVSHTSVWHTESMFAALSGKILNAFHLKGGKGRTIWAPSLDKEMPIPSSFKDISLCPRTTSASTLELWAPHPSSQGHSAQRWRNQPPPFLSCCWICPEWCTMQLKALDFLP